MNIRRTLRKVINKTNTICGKMIPPRSSERYAANDLNNVNDVVLVERFYATILKG